MSGRSSPGRVSRRKRGPLYADRIGEIPTQTPAFPSRRPSPASGEEDAEPRDRVLANAVAGSPAGRGRMRSSAEARYPRNEGGREQRPDARDTARAGLCAAGCRDWASLRPVLHWIAVSLSNVKRTTAGLPLRRQERQRRRNPASVLVLVKEQLRRLLVLCVTSRREATALPGHHNRLTPRPCRSDPDRSSVCPHPGPAVPGGSPLYGFKCASKNARMRRRASRAHSSW